MECTGAGYYRGAPIVDMDFTQGVWPNRRATFIRTATTGIVTDGFYTDAAGSSFNTFAGLNTPRFFGSRGLLLRMHAATTCLCHQHRSHEHRLRYQQRMCSVRGWLAQVRLHCVMALAQWNSSRLLDVDGWRCY